MSEDLIKRLRERADTNEAKSMHTTLYSGRDAVLDRAAASRIQSLEARERVLREALERIDKLGPPPHFDPSAYSGKSRDLQIAGDIARAALAGDAP